MILFHFLALALQHVFTMNVYVAPFILAQVLALGEEQTAQLIQVTFVASGIATLVQAGVGIRLPVMQGPSFVPLTALAAVGQTGGLPALFGSSLPGAILIALLGSPLKALGKITQSWITPQLGAIITLVIGSSLIPVTMKTLLGLPGNLHLHAAVAATSSLSLFYLTYGRLKSKRLQSFFRSCGVLLALGLGTLLSVAGSPENFAPRKWETLTQAAWVQLPQLLPFGQPVFHWDSVLLITCIYAIILVESMGTWFAVATVTQTRLDENRINSAGFGQGLGCLFGVLLGSTPLTGYAANAGILAITQETSRRIGFMVGGLLLLLGMMPKLIALFTLVPASAMLGIFFTACVTIAWNGLKASQSHGWHRRDQWITLTPGFLAIFTSLIDLPLEALPTLVKTFFSSGICVGSVAAILLNRIWSAKPSSALDDASNQR